MAVDDLVVGIFPGPFEQPLFRFIDPDLGRAGFDGFEDGRFKKWETQFIEGGHSAALHPDKVQSIVDFVLDGTRVDAEGLSVEARPWRFTCASRLRWMIWTILLAAVVLVGVAMVHVARRVAPSTVASPRAIAWAVSAAYVAVLLMALQTI